MPTRSQREERYDVLLKKIEDMGNLMSYKGPAETAEFFGKSDKLFRASLTGK